MDTKKVRFITGAGRGMGKILAKAALNAGHKDVATGRHTDAVSKAIGEAESDHLLMVQLDVTRSVLPIMRKQRSGHIISISSGAGFFRTEFLTKASSTYAKHSIEDYEDRRANYMSFFNEQNGQQTGDPVKLAKALLIIVSEAKPPQRFIAGSDAIDIAEQKIIDLQAQINAYRDLSLAMAYEN